MECECGTGRPVSQVCTRCDAPLCEECGEDVAGKTFCGSCAAFVAQRQASRLQPPAPPAVGAEADGEAASVAEDVYAGPLAEPDAEPDAASPQTPPPPPVSDADTAGAVGDDIYRPQQTSTEPPAWNSSVGGVELSGEGGGSTARAALFSIVAGALGVMVWYFVGVGFEKNFSLVSIAVGAVTGVGALVGSGGGGQRAAALAATIGLAAMVLGDYLVMDELFRRDAQHFAAENAEYLAGLERAARDGFSARDVRSLYEISLSEWRELSEEDRIDLRDSLQLELDELHAVQRGESILSFREFLNLELFRAKTLFIFGIGVLAAWRTGLGTD